MGKVAHKLSTLVVAGLFAGLLAPPASAAEEMVVYGSTSSQGVIRAEIHTYLRELNAELRAAIDEALKQAPKVELARNDARSSG
jgi:hypothetical protein